MNRRGLAWAGYPESMGSYSNRYDPSTGTGGIPLANRGYIQIIDFTDPENTQMVARYEVPEFGTHNPDANLEPRTQPEPRTQNLEPRTWNPEPRT